MDKKDKGIVGGGAVVGTGIAGNSLKKLWTSNKEMDPLVEKGTNVKIIKTRDLGKVKKNTKDALVYFLGREHQDDPKLRKMSLKDKFPKAKIINDAKTIGLLDDKWNIYDKGGFKEHMPLTYRGDMVKSETELNKLFPQGYIAKDRVGFAGKGLKKGDEALKHIGNKNVVFQEKLPTNSFKNEYRVLTANGRVAKVQGRSTGKIGAGGDLAWHKSVPWNKGEAVLRQNIKDFVETDIIPKLNHQAKGVNAFDVVNTPKGFKILENDLGISSTAGHPINKGRIMKAIKEGKVHPGPIEEFKAVRGAKAGLAVAGAAGAYGAYKHFMEKKSAAKDHKTEIALGAAGTAGVARGMYEGKNIVSKAPSIPLKGNRTAIFAINPKAGAGHMQMANNLQEHFGKNKADVFVLENYVKDKKNLDKITDYQLKGVGLKKTKLMQAVEKRKKLPFRNLIKAMDSEYNFSKARSVLENDFDKERLVKDLREGGYGRVMVTQGRPAKYLNKYLGIKPEFLISDYSNTKAWMRADPNVSKVHMPEFNLKDAANNKIKLEGKNINVIPSIPISKKFYEKGSIGTKEAIGLHPTKKNLFVFGGGGGSYVDEATKNIAETLKETGRDKKYQINVVTGHRDDLYKNIEAMKKTHPNISLLTDESLKGKGKPLGFNTKIKEIMSHSDLNVIRTGGPSLTEAMVVNKPYVGYVTDSKKDEIGKQIVDNIDITDSKKMLFRDKKHIKSVLDEFEKTPDVFKSKHSIKNPYKAIESSPQMLEQRRNIINPRKSMRAIETTLLEAAPKMAKAVERFRAPGLAGAALLGTGAAIYAAKKRKEK